MKAQERGQIGFPLDEMVYISRAGTDSSRIRKLAGLLGGTQPLIASDFGFIAGADSKRVRNQTT
jgi:hypothetical protein